MAKKKKEKVVEKATEDNVTKVDLSSKEQEETITKVDLSKPPKPEEKKQKAWQ